MILVFRFQPERNINISILSGGRGAFSPISNSMPFLDWDGNHICYEKIQYDIPLNNSRIWRSFFLTITFWKMEIPFLIMSLIIMGHIPSLKMACDCLGLSITVCLLPHCTHTFCVLTNVIWPWFYLANNGPRCLFISHQQKGLWKSLYIRLLPTWFSLLYTDV